MRGNQQAIRVNASKKVLWGWVEYTTAYYWKYTPNGPVQFGKEVKSGHDIMIVGNPFPNGAKLYMWTRGTGEENCGIFTNHSGRISDIAKCSSRILKLSFYEQESIY